MMKCNKCDWEGEPDLIETGPHTKAVCGACGAYIKMVGKKELDQIIEATMQAPTKAFTITHCKTPRGCSACYTENPNGWCIKNEVIKIELFNVKMFLCKHHVGALINALKNFK